MGKNLKNIKTEEFVVIESGSTFGDGCLIRSHTIIYGGNKIGNNFQTGHGVLIRENNKIGNNVSIGSHSVVEHDVVIEDHCRIHSNVFIPESSVLKKNCWIGPCVVLTNAKYPRSKNVKQNLKGVIVSENAKIGAGAVILPGVKIGQNALVGAGSVVTEDVLENVVVAGNPAKVIKNISEIKAYEETNL
ncbi:N-acetyltransferase [Candidatus Daviesbacteria bacterium]|nr:N-acetyltransferase [Candidatus Daviesbacteria bacterium]